MCNPASIAAMQIAGTAQQAMGAINSGSAESSYYNYLATQNEIQAGRVVQAADVNTGLVSGAAAREETNLNRDVAVTEGAQKAAGAASGVYAGSRTAQDIATDTANKADLDRAAIRQNAGLQSRKIALEANNEASALRSQAVEYRAAGENAVSAARTNAITSVLGGATSVASKWYQWKQLKGGGSKDPLGDTYGGV